MTKWTPDGITTKETAALFDTLNPLLTAMFKEFQELSKKKPDGQVGKTKAKIVNRLLEGIHKIIKDEPNRSYVDMVDEDDLPQNSDVVLILSQASAAMDAFYEKYRYNNGSGQNIWSIK
jgi:hypothetical protein